MAVAVPRPSALRGVPGRRYGFRPPSRGIFVSMGDSSMFSRPQKGGDNETSPGTYNPSLASLLGKSTHADLRLDRLQPLDLESRCRLKRVFGRFVAREALLEEELWTASWLRAESHWEDQPYLRYVKNYKKKFAEQEFAALKRRCSEQNAEKCTCIVVVKRGEKDVKRTVLNSVVGSLDISVRFLLRGETYPGERATNFFSNVYRGDGARYGYIANLCVAKCARRQGIGSNMLYLAIEAAKSDGVDQIFVHVDRENAAAQKLYAKLGFQVIELAPSHPLGEQKCLMRLNC